jgi:uncharacterized membrane protein YeiH
LYDSIQIEPNTAASMAASDPAVGGGVIRDVLGNEAPSLFRPGQFLAMIALGALLIYALIVSRGWLNGDWAAWLVIGLAFVVRLLVIRYDIRTQPADEMSLTITRSLGKLPYVPRRHFKGAESPQDVALDKQRQP